MSTTKKSSVDPLRAELLDKLAVATDNLDQLRDYAIVPGNVWLAKNELQKLAQLISEIEETLESIKRDDVENGY